jgi:hypothetical protein
MNIVNIIEELRIAGSYSKAFLYSVTYGRIMEGDSYLGHDRVH